MPAPISAPPAALPAARVSGARLTGMYLSLLVGGVLLVWLLFWLAERFFGVSPESGAMGVLVPVFAAMAVGQGWYQREGARPASGRAWAMAALWTLLTLAIQAGLLALAWQAGLLDELFRRGGPSDEDIRIFAMAMLGIGVLLVLAMRAMLWAAFRSAEKQAERKAKTAR